MSDSENEDNDIESPQKKPKRKTGVIDSDEEDDEEKTKENKKVYIFSFFLLAKNTISLTPLRDI